MGTHNVSRISKMQILEDRHPGLIQNVDEMLGAFMTVRAISAALRTQYGERLSHTSIWTYKRQFWNVQRDRIRAAKAFQTALQELASEERN